MRLTYFLRVLPKLQFKQLLVNSPTAKEYLQKEVTIFAPSDAYMEKYKGPKDEQFILNHIGKEVNLRLEF